jgi:cytoskeletal protein RodZ
MLEGSHWINKMKTKTIKKRLKPSLKEMDKKKQDRVDKFHILAIAIFAIVVGILAVFVLYSIITTIINLVPKNNSTDVVDTPKDIDWFYNRSSKLSNLKSNIDNITERITAYRQKHGTDINGYTPNERTQLESMSAALILMKTDYNSIAVEYNSNRDQINRSWNKTLPRQIYDIP